MKELQHRCQGCHSFSKPEDPGKRAVINMCQARSLYYEASVCGTVKVWEHGGLVWCGVVGGLQKKRNTKEHEWAITSCFCFPALPVFNEV